MGQVNALPPLKVVQLLGNACLSPTMKSGVSSPFLPEKMNRHRAKKLGRGALDYLQSHPFCKKETLGS